MFRSNVSKIEPHRLCSVIRVCLSKKSGACKPSNNLRTKVGYKSFTSYYSMPDFPYGNLTTTLFLPLLVTPTISPKYIQREQHNDCDAGHLFNLALVIWDPVLTQKLLHVSQLRLHVSRLVVGMSVFAQAAGTNHQSRRIPIPSEP